MEEWRLEYLFMRAGAARRIWRLVSSDSIFMDGSHLSTVEPATIGQITFSCVAEVQKQLKRKWASNGPAIARGSVRSYVLLAGQRIMYGKSSPEADVLEDESEPAFWCWKRLCQFWKNHGVEAQVNNIRKASLKLNKSVNL